MGGAIGRTVGGGREARSLHDLERLGDEPGIADSFLDVADMRAKFAEQRAIDRVALVGPVERQRAHAVRIVAQDQRFAHAPSPRVLAIASRALPLSIARLPNCSRMGTNSGITSDRRSQLAASTTKVCPLI